MVLTRKLKSTIIFLSLVTLMLFGYGKAQKLQFDIIPTNEARAKIKAGALVLDVRNLDEFNSGHLAGALNIPYDQVAGRVSELGPDKDREIVVYCAVGGRSFKAMNDLKAAGFTRVSNGGGYKDLLE